MTSSSQQETISLIRHIASELYNPIKSRMSVFVGAGFSKNADPQMPSWSELGERFALKLGLNPDRKELHPQYIMDMASKIEHTYGRSTLNQLIKQSTIETQYPFDELHKLLVEQPWRDIFTTNYDRHLENAALSIPQIAYQTITHPNQLVGSSSPRIVKLHGCISTDQYIISSEDYSTYTHEYASYVNTVRQALLETNCCLIGFSGNDPNFKSWINWVRDVLGPHQTSKIYLITKDTYTGIEKQSLAHQNIVVIDMSVLTGETTHTKALHTFFTELINYKNNHAALNIPTISSDDLSELIQNFSYQVKKLQSEYPGWTYMPSDYRDQIMRFTLNDLLTKIHEYSNYDFTEILQHLAWLMNLCLLPINHTLAMQFQRYLTRKLNDKNSNDSSFKPMINLLLRYYRQTNKLNEWKELNHIATLVLERIQDSDYENSLYAEQIAQNIYQLNFSNIHTLLHEWPKVTTPYWQARRAMYYAYFGNINEAISILRVQLEYIRKEINIFQTSKNMLSTDLLSQEAIILFCLININRIHTFASQKNDWLEFKNIRNKASNRMLQLRNYRIDIDNEIQLFEYIIMNDKYVDSFQPFMQNTNSLYDNDLTVKACQYLNFLECIGFSFPPALWSGNKNAHSSLIKHLQAYLPHASLIYSYCSNNKSMEVPINANTTYIHSLSIFAINTLCENVLTACNMHLEKHVADLPQRPPATLPAILALLVTKASHNKRQEVFKFIKNVFLKNKLHFFSDLDILIQSLVSSISPTELHEHAIDFVNWGFQASTHNSQLDHKYWHPFMYLNANEMFFHDLPVVDIDENILHDIISYSQLRDSLKRQWYSVVLFGVLKYGIYSKPSKEYVLKHLPRNPDSTLPVLSVLGSNLVPLAEQWGDQPSDAAVHYLKAILTGQVIIEHNNDYSASQELVNVLWKLEQLKTTHNIYPEVYTKLFEQYNLYRNKLDNNQTGDLDFLIGGNRFYSILYYTTLLIFLPKFELLTEETQQQIEKVVSYSVEISKNSSEKGSILGIANNIKNESDSSITDIYRELFFQQQNIELAINNAIDLFRAVFTFKLSSLSSNEKLRLLILSRLAIYISGGLQHSRAYWINALYEYINEAANDNSASDDLYDIVTATISALNRYFFESNHYNHQSSILEEINLLSRSSLLARKAYDLYKHKHPEIRSVVNCWVVRILDPNTTDDKSRPLHYQMERLIWKDVMQNFAIK